MKCPKCNLDNTTVWGKRVLKNGNTRRYRRCLSCGYNFKTTEYYKPDKCQVAKYRKKPVVIEAYQTQEEMIIHTLEGDMKASVGDYIITGVNGEKYPCKPDIFEQTYERVEE